jgi:DNA repair exonuclease SbcCD ATPase subunit
LFIGTLTSLSLSLLMYFINQIPISIILTLIAIFTFIKALFAIININKLKTTESTIQEYLLTKQELYGRLCSEAENQDNILEDYRSLESKLQVLAKKSDAISESLKLLDEIDSIEIGAIKEIILDSLVPSLSNIIQELNEINSHEFSSDIFGKLPTLLRNIDEIMTKRIESETKATTLAKDISNKDNEIEDLTQKSEILRNQTSELSILEEKLENNLRILNLEISPNFITELNNELGDIDKLNRTLTIEEGKIPELKKQSDSIPNLKKRIRKMEKDSNILRDKINNLPKKEEFDQDDLDKINDEIIKLEAIITKLNIKKGNFEGSIGEKKNETEDIEKLKETRATLENEMQELSMEYESYNELRKSFNDLQKKIRTGISPQLQQYFSWMLPRITNNRYKMVKVGDDLKMQVYSEERHGFVNLIHLSGGTIDQLLLALRLGFARALSKSRGTDDQLFIFLDEPFSSFDEGRRLAFIDFIKNFEKTFHQIFLISHIDGLENYVDYHIRIEKDSEGNSYAKASWAD